MPLLYFEHEEGALSGFHLDFQDGPHAGKIVSFDKETISIGRADDADLILREMGVSWKHAELRLRDGHYWVVDSGSTNGTYVNDERAHNARLKEGDVLRFGKKAGAARFGLGPGAQDRSVDAAEISSAEKSSKLETKRHADPLAAGADAGIPTPKPLPAVTATPKPASETPAASRLARSDLPPVAPARESGSVLWPLAAAFLFVLCLGLGLYVVLFSADASTLGDAERRALDAEAELRTLQAGQRAQLDAARAEGRRLAEEEVAARLEQAQRQLEREQRRARETAKEQEETVEQLRRELARANDQIRQLRTVGGANGGGDSDWKQIDDGLARSVVLIMCQAEGVKRETGERVPLHGWGTGFFVTRRGDLITNKHVVQPWKYKTMVTQMAKEGIEIDASKTQIHVWIRGSKFRDDPKGHQLNLAGAYSTANGTLELVRTSPDLWTTMGFKEDEAPIRSTRVHKDVINNDLALLRVIPKDGMRFTPIPIGDSRTVSALDEVMVLGFPGGPTVLEGVIAAASPVTGKVRKPESSLLIGAPMIPGNSGGPLIDREGKVVGICAAIQGSESLGYCIRIEHAMALLNGGKIK
ncbi:MAG: trypsin-like peptidase domain-containing protein [Planctomycetes bacterium]|nr:trypsin-like peptidase domain-containing protein [Planctomycetota bacterium]